MVRFTINGRTLMQNTHLNNSAINGILTYFININVQDIALK